MLGAHKTHGGYCRVAAPTILICGVRCAEMKKIYTSPNLSHCDMVRLCLEQSGVACMIKNENTSRMAGGGVGLIAGAALGYAWPEVWVLDDRQVQEAEGALIDSKLSFLTNKDLEHPGAW